MRQVKEGFLRLETIETWNVWFRGWMGKTKYLRAFEQGMVVGARHTGLCQQLQCFWVFHAQQFPVCIKNGPPHKGTQPIWETCHKSIHEVVHWCWAIRPGSQSAFQWIPKVTDGVEFRGLCRPVKFFHTALDSPVLYGPRFVQMGLVMLQQEMALPKLFPGWKDRII